MESITQSKIRQGSGLITELNHAQREAVSYESGPLLIVAGAGTGKTTVITKRIAWLILEKGLNPENILALTFTDKAATEMEERVDRLLPYGYIELWISTFHSFAERILKEHAMEIGLSTDFKLLDTTAAWLLVRRNLNRFALKYYKPLGNPTKFIHALIAHFSRAKDELVGAQEYLNYVEQLKLNNDSDLIIGGEKIPGELRGEELTRLDEIANAYHVYEQLLLEENAMDFGGLMNRVVELLKMRPKILEKYRSQFKYILVDEFQDTNHAQYELVKLLAAPRNNLTVVGDDDQSVYKFRGASISNILEFKKDFPQSCEIFLTENYRSAQPILDLAYQFIQQNNPNRLEVRLGDAGISKKLKAAVHHTSIIRHIHADTLHGEAHRVAQTILELKEKNTDMTWNDCAVLVRANDHAGIFIRTFDEVGIPYELVTVRGLYTEPVIMDLIAYAKLLDDYRESPVLYRVLTSPIARLEDGAISELLHFAHKKSVSLFEALKNAAALDLNPEMVAECCRLVGLIEKHTARARRLRASTMLFVILEETEYLKALSAEDSEENRKALRHVNQLYRKITSFEGQEREPTLKRFLDSVSLEIESGEEGRVDKDPHEGPETVKILTCHAAKGLEFRYVFVVNMVDRRFPTNERREPIELPDGLVKEILTEGDAHLEEERRLFYVACTRAEEGLFFTSADDYGGARKKKLSRFLLELKELGYGDVMVGNDSITVNSAKQSPEVTTRLSVVPTKEHTTSIVLPDKFSFTQLKAFEICPLQYKFAHILKIPVKGRATFSFGKTIHTTLQKFCELIKTRNAHEQKNLFGSMVQSVEPLPVSLQELNTLYDTSWIDDWFTDEAQKKEYYEKGKTLLRLFYGAACENPPRPRYIEQAFHLKIDGYTLKGVIDRVDEQSDGTLEIIDYKTGASKEIEKIDTEQLYIYQLAATEVFHEKPGLLTYYYVEDGKKVSFLGNSEDLEKMKNRIRAQIEEMKTSSFPATPSKQICHSCDFKDICQFRIL